MNYTETIPYKLAKLLENRIVGEGFGYAAEGGVTATWDNYLGTKKYEEGDFIDDGDYIHGKNYQAPTYAEVLDWLKDSHGIVVEFSPAFTYATQDNVAYYVSAYSIDKEQGGLFPVFENEMEMYSFPLGVYEVVKKLIEEYNI